MATVDFNNCGTYMQSDWYDCHAEKWDGSAFIDSGSSNNYRISFISDEDRSDGYPPYTLTSLRVAINPLGGSSTIYNELILKNPSGSISAGYTVDHTYYFDPPISSDRLSAISIWADYYATRILAIEATGTFSSQTLVSGTVYECDPQGVPVPGAYPVRAYDRLTGELAAEVTSVADGTYSITGLDSTREYYIVAVDTNEPFQQSAIADYVTPTVT